MTDIYDRATDLEEAERDRALAEVRGRVQHGDWQVLSAVECAECGEFIDLARRKALPGVQLCIECAEAAERAALIDRRTRGI